jgi:hypothetical protein
MRIRPFTETFDGLFAPWVTGENGSGYGLVQTDNRSHGVKQLFDIKRFADGHVPFRQYRAAKGIGGRRDKNNRRMFESWALLQLLEKLDPIHGGHSQVQRDNGWMHRIETGQSFLTAGTFHYFMTGVPEHFRDKLPDSRVVVDNQYRPLFLHSCRPPSHYSGNDLQDADQ